MQSVSPVLTPPPSPPLAALRLALNEKLRARQGQHSRRLGGRVEVFHMCVLLWGDEKSKPDKDLLSDTNIMNRHLEAP